MKSAFLCLLLVGTLVSSACGYGYIFSRFRPDSSNNWSSYNGASYGNPSERLSPREQLMEALLTEELLEEEVCAGRRCTSNEHCCSGHICLNFDGTAGGTCMAVENQRMSSGCSSDLDCNDGQVCELGSCNLVTERKGYSEPCLVSSECDFGRGLCCQLIRRHRQAPRKMCSYFTDPLNCIGHMEKQKRSRPSQ